MKAVTGVDRVRRELCRRALSPFKSYRSYKTLEGRMKGSVLLDETVVYACSFEVPESDGVPEELELGLLKIGVATSLRKRLPKLKRDAATLFGAEFGAVIATVPLSEEAVAVCFETFVLRNLTLRGARIRGEWFQDTARCWGFLMQCYVACEKYGRAL